MGRADNTLRRRREILDAALACFHVLSYEKTTLADISDRANASIGSIYHLFAGKEQLFAALYLEAIAEAQGYSLRALRRAKSAEEGVRALVRSYLRWASKNRELASYLLTMRRAEFMSEAEPELERMNAAFRDEFGRWFATRQAGRELPAIGTDLLLAILVGPSEEFARRWLRGKTTTSLREAGDTLATAAWLSLRGLREAQKAEGSFPNTRGPT
jgi:AcrR family transcriptional regulator